jgi:hypothetical protein
MNCREAQRAFPLYVDNQLSPSDIALFEGHIYQCPTCHSQYEEMRSMVDQLGKLTRPLAPTSLASSISSAIAIESAVSQREIVLPLSTRVIEWIRPRIMPYTVGSFASVLLFIAVLSALLPHFKILHDLEVAAYLEKHDTSEMDIAWVDGLYPLSPASTRGYAARRIQYSVDSPSINPLGGLAAFESRPSYGTGDDEMVVVADVFINGTATLADVVHAPRDPRLLDELQRALRESPAFVPAAIDHRPKTMRVVLAIQKVDVHDQSF